MDIHTREAKDEMRWLNSGPPQYSFAQCSKIHQSDLLHVADTITGRQTVPTHACGAASSLGHQLTLASDSDTQDRRRVHTRHDQKNRCTRPAASNDHHRIKAIIATRIARRPSSWQPPLEYKKLGCS